MPSFRIKPILWMLGLGVLFCGTFLAATRAANAILARRYPPPGRMVPVGAHRLHLYCFGSGSPAVIIEPGLGTDWSSWRKVAAQLMVSNQVCVYDRAGYGWSEPGPKPRTAGQCATELHALLVNGKVPGPYILVGHSFGGLIARVYASRFPESLAGVVLADPFHEDEGPLTPKSTKTKAPERFRISGLLAWIPPLGWERVKRMYQGEAALPGDLKTAPPPFRNRYIVGASLEQLEAEKSELGSPEEHQEQGHAAKFPRNIPLTVITAMHVPRLAPLHFQLHELLAQSSALGRHIAARDSGHFVHVDRPDLITEAVRNLSRPFQPASAARRF